MATPEKLAITISDAIGKIVLKTNISRSDKYTLDLSSLSHGLYIASFTEGTKRITAKLIKK
jgi:hypothetical protein